MTGEGLSANAAALIVVVNAALVAVVLVAVGWWLGHRTLSVTEPSAVQNTGEAILDFFVGKAREMAHGPQRARIISLVTPLLATFFIFILVSNLIAIVPLPQVNRPPTSYYSVTLTLAFLSVISTILISAAGIGTLAALKHLVWPNPLEWVSKATDVLSLSLRLFGNIAGEYLTLTLVVTVVPVGIPLILHALGLIPAFVQALVFTLLTASFLGSSLHEEVRKSKEPAQPSNQPVVSTATAAASTTED